MMRIIGVRGIARPLAIPCGALLTLLVAVEAKAQSQQTLTINATVNTRAELVLSPTTINFPDASPTSTPNIAADSVVTVTARVRTSGTPTLTVLASGDLISGTDSIPISNVSWTAGGVPFLAGTMDAVTAQSGATFAAGSGSYSGSFSYSLANSWSHPIGNFSQTTVYTLTAP